MVLTADNGGATWDSGLVSQGQRVVMHAAKDQPNRFSLPVPASLAPSQAMSCSRQAVTCAQRSICSCFARLVRYKRRRLYDLSLRAPVSVGHRGTASLPCGLQAELQITGPPGSDRGE